MEVIFGKLKQLVDGEKDERVLNQTVSYWTRHMPNSSIKLSNGEMKHSETSKENGKACISVVSVRLKKSLNSTQIDLESVGCLIESLQGIMNIYTKDFCTIDDVANVVVSLAQWIEKSSLTSRQEKQCAKKALHIIFTIMIDFERCNTNKSGTFERRKGRKRKATSNEQKGSPVDTKLKVSLKSLEQFLIKLNANEKDRIFCSEVIHEFFKFVPLSGNRCRPLIPSLSRLCCEVMKLNLKTDVARFQRVLHLDVETFLFMQLPSIFGKKGIDHIDVLVQNLDQLMLHLRKQLFAATGNLEVDISSRKEEQLEMFSKKIHDMFQELENELPSETFHFNIPGSFSMIIKSDQLKCFTFVSLVLNMMTALLKSSGHYSGINISLKFVLNEIHTIIDDLILNKSYDIMGFPDVGRFINSSILFLANIVDFGDEMLDSCSFLLRSILKKVICCNFFMNDETAMMKGFSCSASISTFYDISLKERTLDLIKGIYEKGSISLCISCTEIIVILSEVLMSTIHQNSRITVKAFSLVSEALHRVGAFLPVKLRKEFDTFAVRRLESFSESVKLENSDHEVVRCLVDFLNLSFQIPYEGLIVSATLLNRMTHLATRIFQIHRVQCRNISLTVDNALNPSCLSSVPFHLFEAKMKAARKELQQYETKLEATEEKQSMEVEIEQNIAIVENAPMNDKVSSAEQKSIQHNGDIIEKNGYVGENNSSNDYVQQSSFEEVEEEKDQRKHQKAVEKVISSGDSDDDSDIPDIVDSAFN